MATITFPSADTPVKTISQNTRILASDPDTGTPITVIGGDILTQASINNIGYATTSTVPTGNESAGQSYTVSNTTTSDEYFTNFITPDSPHYVIVPAKSSGRIIKYAAAAGSQYPYYWAFSQDVFDKTGLVQTDELVTDVSVSPSTEKALASAVIPQLTTKAEIINNVISPISTQPLAASQGKALNDKIDSINSTLNDKIDSVSNLAQSAYIGVLYPDSSLPSNPDNNAIWGSVSNIKPVPIPDDGSNDDIYINFKDTNGDSIIVPASTSGNLSYNGTYWTYLQNNVNTQAVIDAVATPFTNDFFDTI